MSRAQGSAHGTWTGHRTPKAEEQGTKNEGRRGEGEEGGGEADKGGVDSWVECAQAIVGVRPESSDF